MNAAGRLPTLDGWRAIAIGLVLWHHFVAGAYTDQNLYWASDKSQLGAFGVDIFFGLSGFLITTLLLREETRTGAISLRGFYTRRACRILPPCFIFVLTIAALGLARSPLEIASCLFFFRNVVVTTSTGWYTGHLWSLAVEEHFYLLWPLLLVSLTRAGKDARLVAYLSVAFGLWRIFDTQTGLLSNRLPGLAPHFRTDLRADALLWGCFVGYLVRTPASCEQWKRYLSAPVSIGLTFAATACVLFYSQLASLWFAMLVPALLASTALHPEWLASRVLEIAPLGLIGRVSYSLYLWQQLFLAPGWERKFSPFHNQWANLALAFACAAISYQFVEKPFIAIGRRLATELTQKNEDERASPEHGNESAGDPHRELAPGGRSGYGRL